MSDQEILDFVAGIHYPRLYVPLSKHNHKHCGPGQDRWEQDLAKLDNVERSLLSARIERHLQLLAVRDE